MRESWILGFQMKFDTGAFIREGVGYALQQPVERLRADRPKGFPEVPVQGSAADRDLLLVYPECLCAYEVFHAAGYQWDGEEDAVQAFGKVAQGLGGKSPALDSVFKRWPGANKKQQAVLSAEMVRIIHHYYARPLLDNVCSAAGKLAQDYGAWVVAGSLYAPRIAPTGSRETPYVLKEGYALEPTYSRRWRQYGSGGEFKERIWSLSLVFDPEGILRHVVPKCFPTPDECEVGVSGADPEDWDTVDTGTYLGVLAVIICADSWFSSLYPRATVQGARVLVVPSMSDLGLWDRRWNGFSSAHAPLDDRSTAVALEKLNRAWPSRYERRLGSALARVIGEKQAMPVSARRRLRSELREVFRGSVLPALRQRLAGVDLPDGIDLNACLREALGEVGEITEDAAWLCFALSRRLPPMPSSQVGINVFPVGDLFETSLGGRSIVVWTDTEHPQELEQASLSKLVNHEEDEAVLAVKMVDGKVAWSRTSPRAEPRYEVYVAPELV